MNNPPNPASKGLRMASICTRRRLLTAVAAGAIVVGFAPEAIAAGPLTVTVPQLAVGAIVKAVGGSHVRVVVDATLEPDALRVGEQPVSLRGKVMLKGKGSARRRFLDDPRNAPKVGAAIRDALVEASPAFASQFAQNHQAWSRPFARKVLAWQGRLRKGKLVGKAVRDDYGRRYVLEWAGARVDPKGSPSPTKLGSVPGAPEAGTLAAYTAYIERLVGALV